MSSPGIADASSPVGNGPNTPSFDGGLTDNASRSIPAAARRCEVPTLCRQLRHAYAGGGGDGTPGGAEGSREPAGGASEALVPPEGAAGGPATRGADVDEAAFADEAQKAQEQTQARPSAASPPRPPACRAGIARPAAAGAPFIAGGRPPPHWGADPRSRSGPICHCVYAIEDYITNMVDTETQDSIK